MLKGLTLLGPQSRFGDKLLIIRLLCPHVWECGSKRVNFKHAWVAAKEHRQPQRAILTCGKKKRLTTQLDTVVRATDAPDARLIRSVLADHSEVNMDNVPARV